MPNFFGLGNCQECSDLSVFKTHVAKISVANPESGVPASETDHTGPAIVAPPGHIMVIYRGHDTKTVAEGQIASLCGATWFACCRLPKSSIGLA